MPNGDHKREWNWLQQTCFLHLDFFIWFCFFEYASGEYLPALRSDCFPTNHLLRTARRLDVVLWEEENGKLTKAPWLWAWFQCLMMKETKMLFQWDSQGWVHAKQGEGKLDSWMSVRNKCWHSKDKPCIEKVLEGVREAVEVIGRLMIDRGTCWAERSWETEGSICQGLSLSFSILRRTLQYAETHREKCEFEDGILSLKALLMFRAFWDGHPFTRYWTIWQEWLKEANSLLVGVIECSKRKPW